MGWDILGRLDHPSPRCWGRVLCCPLCLRPCRRGDAASLCLYHRARSVRCCWSDGCDEILLPARQSACVCLPWWIHSYYALDLIFLRYILCALTTVFIMHYPNVCIWWDDVKVNGVSDRIRRRHLRWWQAAISALAIGSQYNTIKTRPACLVAHKRTSAWTDITQSVGA